MDTLMELFSMDRSGGGWTWLRSPLVSEYSTGEAGLVQ
jgi:hypothetical protein